MQSCLETKELNTSLEDVLLGLDSDVLFVNWVVSRLDVCFCIMMIVLGLGDLFCNHMRSKTIGKGFCLRRYFFPNASGLASVSP